MQKIKILAISPDKYGVGKYRIFDPYRHLQDNFGDYFHIDFKIDVKDLDEEFDDYQIVVLHSIIHKNHPFEKTIKRIDWLKKRGTIVIVDTDDYWLPDPKHPAYFNIIKHGVDKHKIQLLKSADYVTTTTPIYAATIKKNLLVKNVYVFPNAVDEKEPQFKIEPTYSEKIRFGWLGGSSHKYDLELIRDGIAKTLSSFGDKVEFFLCGFDIGGTVTFYDKDTNKKTERPIKPEETIWYEYEKIFTSDYKFLSKRYKDFLLQFTDSPYYGPDENYKRIWTTDINNYARNYNKFDVSFAPLIDNVFNNNKSQLKIIESGFFKKAVIASDTIPYTLDLINYAGQNGTINNNGNALLVSQRKGHKQWFQHIVKLIKNPNLIKDLGEALYETVKIKYSLSHVNLERAEFLRTLN